MPVICEGAYTFSSSGKLRNSIRKSYILVVVIVAATVFQLYLTIGLLIYCNILHGPC